METKKFMNPYDSLGEDLSTGLDSIRNNIIDASSFDEINQIVCNYVIEREGSDPGFTYREALSILPNAYNAYLNLEYGNYNLIQYNYIDALYSSIKEYPIESINDIILEFEEKVAQYVPPKEQLPLLICAALAKANNEYWHINANSDSNWKTIFSPENHINYLYIPHIVLASIQGVLFSLCEKKPMSVIKGLDSNETILFNTSLISAMGISTGYIKFKWTPYIKL